MESTNSLHRWENNMFSPGLILLIIPAPFEERKRGIKSGLVRRRIHDWKKAYFSESIKQDFETKTKVIMQKQYLKNVVRFSFG